MHLLLVTGLSGAGKSLALRRLEDLGYYCVDNLPAAMAKEFIDLCRQANPAITRAAVAMDSRQNAFHCDWESTLRAFSQPGVECKVLFLDCRDGTLCRRYSETRRRHPLSSTGDVGKGVVRERELLQGLRDRAHFIIDTSDLKPLDLYRRLEEILHLDPLESMMLLFMSFGYKRGVPMDADLVFDMRFLPNPFYEPRLRPLSGLDQPVREYVLGQRESRMFFEQTEALLRHMMPGFAAQGRQRVMVAFGCTGGRHRSVAAAQEMCRRFSADGKTAVRLFHRDLAVEEGDIRERFEDSRVKGNKG